MLLSIFGGLVSLIVVIGGRLPKTGVCRVVGMGPREAKAAAPAAS